jgi:hypothetical protein
LSRLETPAVIAVATENGNSPADFLRRRQTVKCKIKRISTGYFLLDNISPFPGVLFPVDVAKRLNGFQDVWYPVSDFDFWVRLSENAVIYMAASVGAFYRQTPQQTSRTVFCEIIEKLYARRMLLFGRYGKRIYFFCIFNSMWRMYNMYMDYLNLYGLDANIRNDVGNTTLRKWFSFFHSTNRGIVKYFYKYNFKVVKYILSLIKN